MPISQAVLREHADGLNTLFNAEQATLILNLINAALAESAADVDALRVPVAPTTAGNYRLTVAAGGVTSWTAIV